MAAEQESISWAEVFGLWAFIGLLLVVSGWLVITVTARGADGRLGRNAWAGVRTRTTRSSDEAWKAAHCAAQALTKAGGAGMIVSGLAAPALALAFAGDPDTAMGWWAGAMLAGSTLAVALVIAGAIKGQRAARVVAGP